MPNRFSSGCGCCGADCPCDYDWTGSTITLSGFTTTMWLYMEDYYGNARYCESLYRCEFDLTQFNGTYIITPGTTNPCVGGVRETGTLSAPVAPYGSSCNLAPAGASCTYEYELWVNKNSWTLTIRRKCGVLYFENWWAGGGFDLQCCEGTSTDTVGLCNGDLITIEAEFTYGDARRPGTECDIYVVEPPPP